MTIRICLLGPTALVVDGARRGVERLQVRRLVALLVERGESSADELVEEIWPGELPARPRDALHTVVTRARQTCAAAGIQLVTAAGRHRLDVDLADATDTHRVRSLARAPGGSPVDQLRRVGEALSSWRGRPFEDCSGPPALDAAADDLVQLRLDLVERCAGLQVVLGDLEAAERHARSVLAVDPCREEATLVMVQALAARGRRVEALSLLAETRTRLDRMVGAAPGPRLVGVEEALLRGAPVPTFGAEPVDGRPDPPVRPHGHRRLVERDEALAAVQRLLDEHGPRTLMLLGDEGTGKSSVLEQARTLWDGVVHRVDHDEHDPRALVRFLAPDLPPDRSDRDVASLVDALDRVDSRASASVLLIIDDLHLADDTSLEAIRVRLSRPMGDLSLLLASRPGPAAARPTLARLFAAVAEHGLALELGPLSVEGVRDLLRQFGGIPRDELTRAAREIWEQTGGLPYLVYHAVSAAADPRGPSPLRWSASAALATLTPAAREVVEAASLVGVIRVATLASALLTSRDDVLAALGVAVRCGLLVEDEVGVRFPHALGRAAVTASVPRVERLRLHERLARATESIDPIEHARQVAATGDGSSPAVVAGARAALDRGQLATALELLETAVGAGQTADDDLDDLRWRVLARAGRRAEALALCEGLVERRLAAGQVADAADAALGWTSFGGRVGGDERARATVATVLDRALEAGDVDEGAVARLAEAAASDALRQERPVPRQVAAQLRRAAGGSAQARRYAEVADLRRRALAPLRPAIVDRVRSLRDGALAADDLTVVAAALEMEAAFAARLGLIDRMRSVIGELRVWAPRVGDPRPLWAAALLDALLADLAGDGETAEALSIAALRLGQELDVPDAANARSLFVLARAARHGRLAVLAPVIGRAAAEPDAPRAWRALESAALADAGRRGDAMAALQRYATGFRRGGLFEDIGLHFAWIAATSLDLGDVSWMDAALARWRGQHMIAGVGAAWFGRL